MKHAIRASAFSLTLLACTTGCETVDGATTAAKDDSVELEGRTGSSMLRRVGGRAPGAKPEQRMNETDMENIEKGLNSEQTRIQK